MTQELYQLPDGWEWVSLSTILEKTENINPLRKPDRLWTYIDISSVNHNYLKVVEPKQILGKEAPSRAKKQIQVKDVLFATTRPNLKNIAIVEDEYELPVASTGFCILRANEKVLPAYLFYFVTTDFIQTQIKPYISGASYPAITDRNLKKALIPIPSIEEQKRIVEKLDALLSRIDQATESLQHSIELTDALFASSLDQAFNPLGATVKPDGTYPLPDSWEWKNIEQVALIGAERGYIPETNNDSKVPFVSMSDIDQDTGLNSSFELRNFADVKKGYTRFQKDAVLLAKITPCTENNKTALIKHEGGGFATTEVYPIHAKESITPTYLLNYLRSNTPRRILINKMEGATGRQRVPTKAVKELNIPFPSIREQNKIADIISQLQTKTQATKAILAAKIEQLMQLKSSILNSAFKGEL